MAEYRVSWDIDIEAGGLVRAARQALAIQRDIESSAVVFTVEAVKSGRKYSVDLAEEPSAKRLHDSSATQVAVLLKARFPWLGTPQSIDYADECCKLADLYSELGGKS
jgi:hypothetical protein